MANEMSMALAGLWGKIAMNGDFLREGVRMLAQALMDLDVTQRVGAGRHERTPERTGQRGVGVMENYCVRSGQRLVVLVRHGVPHLLVICWSCARRLGHHLRVVRWSCRRFYSDKTCYQTTMIR